jgi:hypothetical protein
MSILQTLYQTHNVPYLVTGIVILAVGTYVVLSITNKPGFPCFCPKCEHKLIEDAESGDATAQAKLQRAMYDNEAPAYLSMFGPLSFFVLLILLVGVVTVASKIYAQSPYNAQAFLNRAL